MKNIVVLFCLIMSGCAGWKPTVGMPWQWSFLYQGPDGPPEFRQGWRDGCEVGISEASNTFYKGYYKYTKVNGWLLTSSKEYQSGYSTANLYCYRYIYIYATKKGGIMGGWGM